MLAFVVGNTNFNFNRTGMKSLRENSKLKNLQVESKELMEKVKNFNPDSCYDFSDFGDEYDESHTANVTIKSIYNNLNSNAVLDKSQSRIEKQNEFHNLRVSQIIESQGPAGKSILKLKKIIKIIDIFASIMIIAGCIISQIEHENYYYDNLNVRIQTVNLISDLSKVNGNIKLINLTNYNISYLNDATFVEQFNFSNYLDLPVLLVINDNCQYLRYIILVLTIFSIPLIVIGRYIEFIRDYVYIDKFTGNIF